MTVKILVCIIALILAFAVALGLLSIQEHSRKKSLSVIETFVILLLYSGLTILVVGAIGYVLERIFT